MFGYAHHVLLGVLVVAVIVLAGVKVLTGTRAQTPAVSASIGTAASFTATPDQLKALAVSNKTTLSSAEAGRQVCPEVSGEKQLKSLNKQVRNAINDFRKNKSLPTLSRSLKLNASARQHSEEMDAKAYFDHPCYDGTVFWKRIQRYYSSTNYSYWTVGENLVWSTGSLSAADALKLWIGSPEHLRNLKDPNWRDLGVSAVQATNAGGVYGNGTVTIITTDFGARHN